MKLTAESTVLDDKKIGDSFATLQVEADGIRTEVGTKVGNNEVISRINQTAETIKIQADKVNIEGATIFTSGRLSQSSLDGAYDASGSATSAVNGLKTDLSSSSGTTVINGGHIETGTLSAGAVNASSGTFNIANIPTTARNDTYITHIDGDGIRVHPSSTENNSVVINASGMEVFKGGTASANSVAFYGDTARVGKSSTRHIEIKDGGMQVYEDSTTVMGHFGYGQGNNRSNGTSTAPYFTLGKRGTTITAVGNYSVAEGDCAIASGYSSHAEGSWVYINTAGSYGSAGTYYPTASDVAAHAEGEGTLASESAAHAEGVLTVASGYASHAEGNATIASTSGAHAEGIKTSASGTNGSHAEGFTTVASGEHAHAEGAFTTASGDSSHAGGYRTTATRNYQTVIGKYNRLTGSGTAADPYVATNAAFIVGGGVTTTGKDLLTVDWSGNTVIAGTLTQSSDRRLKEHISYVGDEAIEFIDGLKPAHYIKDGEKHLGFYAQDVAEVDKWDCIIGEEMNGYMTLGYMELLAPMVAYIQRLEKRIKELERSK